MPATEFYDKSKKQIFTGDIIQYDLKSIKGGARSAVVVQVKNGYKLCWLQGTEYHIKDGWMDAS